MKTTVVFALVGLIMGGFLVLLILDGAHRL